MQTTQVKAPKPDREFLSPLDHFIEVNCEQCPLWKRENCRLQDSNGLERMMLCMTAQTLGYGMNLECVKP